MTELVQIEGEVIDHSSPVKIPNSFSCISYITVRCPIEEAVNTKMKFAYYVITSYKEYESRKVFNGCKIQCIVQRESNIWNRDGFWQIKHNQRYFDGKKIDMGSHPIIFERYILNSEIQIILEDPQNTEDDIPF